MEAREEEALAENGLEGSYLAAGSERLREGEQEKPNGHRVRMTNILNSQYLGDIYFGSPESQHATVVFDTGSNWLTVTSNLCKNCHSQAYDTTKSRTAIQVDERTLDQKYGSANLNGKIWNDTVCL
mmetsp:Transcript_1194/g.2181  ORF Transcript_1194/g.2181 Transcript_1194/m.2181 type:complete len:126 (+) Transcript_1194:246-623(+)